MTNTGYRPFAALCALALALVTGACSSTARVTLNMPPAQRLEGTTVTTGYTGALQAGPCRGEYSGQLGAAEAPIVLSCADGKHGIGTVAIADGRVSSGTIKLTDGTIATISSGSPPPKPARFDPGYVPFLRPLQQAREEWGGSTGRPQEDTATPPR